MSGWSANAFKALDSSYRGASAVGQFMSGFERPIIRDCSWSSCFNYGYGNNAAYIENRNFWYADKKGFWGSFKQGLSLEALNNPVGMIKLGVDLLGTLQKTTQSQPKYVVMPDTKATDKGAASKNNGNQPQVIYLTERPKEEPMDPVLKDIARRRSLAEEEYQQTMKRLG